MKIGEKIQTLRKQFKDKKGNTGISQSDLASGINVSRTMVVSWEVGRYKPSQDNIKGLSEFFRKPLEYFQDDPEDVVVLRLPSEKCST